jgi:hypothetical protein
VPPHNGPKSDTPVGRVRWLVLCPGRAILATVRLVADGRLGTGRAMPCWCDRMWSCPATNSRTSQGCECPWVAWRHRPGQRLGRAGDLQRTQLLQPCSATAGGPKIGKRHNAGKHGGFRAFGLFWGGPNKPETFSPRRDKTGRGAAVRPSAESRHWHAVNREGPRILAENDATRRGVPTACCARETFRHVLITGASVSGSETVSVRALHRPSRSRAAIRFRHAMSGHRRSSSSRASICCHSACYASIRYSSHSCGMDLAGSRSCQGTPQPPGADVWRHHKADQQPVVSATRS